METLVKPLLTLGIAMAALTALVYGAGYLARAIALRRPEWRLIASFVLSILVVLIVVAAALGINPYG